MKNLPIHGINNNLYNPRLVREMPCLRINNGKYRDWKPYGSACTKYNRKRQISLNSSIFSVNKKIFYLN